MLNQKKQQQQQQKTRQYTNFGVATGFFGERRPKPLYDCI